LNDVPKTIAFSNTPLILISLLCFLLPLAYWPELFEAASLPRYSLIGIFTSLSLLLWVMSGRGNQINWHPGYSLILIFFGWAALSTSWSPDSGTSLINIVQLLSMVLLAFLAMQMSRSVVSVYLVPAILAGAAVAALIGIGQKFGINPLPFRTYSNSIASTFINPNHAAVFFDFIPPLAFAALLYYQSRTIRWLSASILGLSLAFLLINTSRGSLLAMLAGFLVLLSMVLFKPIMRKLLLTLLQQRYREILLAALITILVVLPTGSGQVPSWNTNLWEGRSDVSTNLRLAMYLNSLPAILEHPFTGLGYGGMRVGFQPYTSRLLPIDDRNVDTVLRELHNDPLQYFVELGLPGGLLALAIFLLVSRTGWQTVTSPESRDNDDRMLVLGFWLGLISCGVHALVDFPLRLPASAAMFWLSIGIVLGSGKIRRVRLIANPNRSLRLVLVSISAIGLLFYPFFYSSYIRANHDLYNTIIYLKKGKCVEAADASYRGLETFASDFMLQTAYAQVYSYCTFPPEQKLKAMNRVLRLDPTNMRAKFTRAILYNEANKPELAIPELIKIAEILPHLPYAYAGLGDAARIQGDESRALYYYQAALKRKPDFKYVQQQLTTMPATSRE
jgi:O-antigen ligase